MAQPNPVLHYAGEARRVSRETGIPAEVLLGLVDVESGGVEGRTSSAGARGLTQFMPGTAKSYGVDVTPGHARSQIEGAAHYLVDLGYHDDPSRALASYNAGPGNWQAGVGYAGKVLAAARRYTGASGPGSKSPVVPQDAAQPTSDGGGLLDGMGNGALKALLWIAAVVSGVVLIGLGVKRSTTTPGAAA